ncbi:MAG: Imm51 family immunity protein [Cyclobacteriaceae bacterium]
MKKGYPFQTGSGDHFTISVAIESGEILEKYGTLLEKYGYEPNGYCWEGHIIQILEQEEEGLLDHLEFDPEAGGFYAYADSEKTQLRFIEILSPVFQDLETLENYIKAADRDRIDD